MRPLLFEAEGAQVVVDGATAVRELSVRSVGQRVVMVGQTAPLMALLTGAPLSNVQSTGQLADEPGTGVARLTAGQLRIAGNSVRGREHLRVIGVAPRDPPLPSQWIAHDYLRWIARLRGAKPRQAGAHADAALEHLGLGDLRKRLLGALSPGQRQAMGLARALLGEPQAIALDEPLYGLDAGAKQLMLQLLDRACSGRGVLLSLPRIHPSAPEAALARAASDVCVLRDGRLLLHTTPDELFTAARLYELTVAEGAESLRTALASRGIELAGGPVHFSARTPAAMSTTDILTAAAESRASVLSCQPLLG